MADPATRESIIRLLGLSTAEVEWIEGIFAKICVRAESEEQLLELFHMALEAKLSAELITDSGLTEFHGVPTKTCIAIGPDREELIDPITSGLKLL